jgi:hypothetical protein
MGKNQDNSHVYILKRLTEDAKIAFCNGDVDLDDIIDTELDDEARHRLEGAIRRWGRAREGHQQTQSCRRPFPAKVGHQLRARRQSIVGSGYTL